MSPIPDFMSKMGGKRVIDSAVQNIHATALPYVSIAANSFALFDSGGTKIEIPTKHLDVVIVDANELKGRQYYSKPYDPTAKPEAPDCYSDDCEKPHRDSKHVQNVTCNGCPQDRWNSARTGTGKACREHKRIAVLAPEYSKDIAFRLQIPTQSLKPFQNYSAEVGMSKALADRLGCEVGEVDLKYIVTRITFKWQGVLAFAPVDAITPEIATIAQKVVFDVPGSTDVLVGRRDAPTAIGTSAPRPTLQPATPARITSAQGRKPDTGAPATPRATPFTVPNNGIVAPPVADASVVEDLNKILGE
jgi:hypothetical protein